MDIDELRTRCADLLGNGWQTRLARALGIDGSTVRRWLANGVEAPDYVAAYLDVLAGRQRARGALLAEREDLGTPIVFSPPAPHEVARMTRRLAFAGVDQAKPMPAILSAFNDEGARVISLDGSERDFIAGPRDCFTLTRHPDGRHLEGYLDAIARTGHRAAVVSQKFHHYTLVPFRRDADHLVVMRIATHAGEIRSLSYDPREPDRILRRTLEHVDDAASSAEGASSTDDAESV